MEEESENQFGDHLDDGDLGFQHLQPLSGSSDGESSAEEEFEQAGKKQKRSVVTWTESMENKLVESIYFHKAHLPKKGTKQSARFEPVIKALLRDRKCKLRQKNERLRYRKS
jgi:hypothetical protein